MVSKIVANNYFDEAYFQRGSEKGTAYHDYAAVASMSPTYKEIANAVAKIFKPTRVLEIGCATGPIVKHLNELDIEAHGIDVSAWAIENRLHNNVIHAGADDLPFQDGYFDLIISCHALEHLPQDVFEESLQEINRVTSKNGNHFHLLPIIGTYPYDYNKELAKIDLQKDPTHVTLEEMPWWENKFSKIGYKRLDHNININNDTSNAELSSGQMIYIRHDQDKISSRINSWNLNAYRNLYLDRQIHQSLSETPRSIVRNGRAEFKFQNELSQWSDATTIFDQPLDLTNSEISVLCELEDSNSAQFRIALRTFSEDKNGVLEKWLKINRGVSLLRIRSRDLNKVEGNPDLSNVTNILLGGDLRGLKLSIIGDLHVDDQTIPLFKPSTWLS